jgi:hypothetical protein
MDSIGKEAMIVQLPELYLDDWHATRDSLHTYARMVGNIRGKYCPRQKHWWHITLHVSAQGLTSTPFPIAGQSLELTLDLVLHQLVIESSMGWRCCLPLICQSAAVMRENIYTTLSSEGIELEPDLLEAFDNSRTLEYDADAAGRFRQAINGVDAIFKAFKGELREETSPVQLFPHHMDLAMSWFSGRLVPGTVPDNEEMADEQMTFGFVTGDREIPDAYIYITAYPVPDRWREVGLPAGAYWHNEGWNGAVVPYVELRESQSPGEFLLDRFRHLQFHGARLMS